MSLGGCFSFDDYSLILILMMYYLVVDQADIWYAAKSLTTASFSYHSSNSTRYSHVLLEFISANPREKMQIHVFLFFSFLAEKWHIIYNFLHSAVCMELCILENFAFQYTQNFRVCFMLTLVKIKSLIKRRGRSFQRNGVWSRIRP